MSHIYDSDAGIKVLLDEWIRLLGLKRWRITYSVEDEPIGGDPKVVAWSVYEKAHGEQQDHIRFYRPHVSNERDAEEAVIHELLHLFDHGLGLPSALHRYIGRLERPLRLLRKRARVG